MRVEKGDRKRRNVKRADKRRGERKIKRDRERESRNRNKEELGDELDRNE